MANEFKVKNGLIVIGDLTTSGTITINGALAATQSWVTSQAYLTSASLSGYATQSYVTSAIAALVDAAPTTLDTLNELAAALGDDANFSTTVTNSIATKLPLAGGTLTGDLTLNYAYPRINLYDSNNDSDYSLINNDGVFSVYDVTNNAHRIWITAAGNIGIGTNSPAEKLSVNGTFSSNSIWTTNASITLWGAYSTAYGGLTWDTGQATVYATSGNKLYLAANGSSPNVTISTTGNVGIGTTSPSYKLDVNGSTNIVGAFNINGIDQTRLGFMYPYYKTLTLSSATADSWYKIATVGASPQVLKFKVTTDGDNTLSADEFIVSTAGYNFQMNIMLLPSVMYNTSKLAEIRAINPSSGGSVEIWVKVLANTLSTVISVYGTVPLETLVGTTTAPTNAGGWTALPVTTASRNQGINLSRGIVAGGDITTSQSIQVGNHSASRVIGFGGWTNYIAGDSSSNYLVFYSNGSERMRINSSGNVMIGTSTDGGFKLDVNGTFRVQSIPAATANYNRFLVSNSGALQYRVASEMLSDIDVTGYVSSRGENLVTNGTGLRKTNYNFSAFTFVGSEAYYSTGSFRDTTFTSALTTDEAIPVDVNQRYRLSVSARQNPYVGARYYVGVSLIDADNLPVNASNHMYKANTLTTLAAQLNPGDTVVYLTNAANWENGGTAGVNTHLRSFIFWNYVNSFGYAFPALTYSRNYYGNMWNPGGVNTTTNTITLITPWAGPVIAAGTQLSNGSSGGTFKYITASNVQIPNAWTTYTGIIEGVDTTGTNVTDKFAPGTAAIKILFLNNRDVAGATVYYTNVQFGLDLINPNTHILNGTSLQTANFNISGNGYVGGNVGVGNTSPSYKLDVNGTIRTQTGYILGANGSADITIDGSTGSQLRYGTQRILLNSADASIFTASVNRLHINSSGNVGIGTTGPGAKLDVVGTGRFSDVLSFAGDTRYGVSKVYNSATGDMFGMEQASAAQTGTASAATRIFASGTTSTNYISLGKYTDATTFVDLLKVVVGTGNVGIGTSSPSHKLDISGNAALDEYLYHRDNLSQFLRFVDTSTATLQSANLNFSLGATSAPQGGDIQFASANGSDFTVSYTRTGAAVWKQKFVGQTMEWQNNAGNTVFYANNAGNVGIGTTSPSAPLTFGKSVYAAPTSEDFFRIKIQDLGGINNDVGIGQPATESLAFNTGAAGYTAFLEGTNGERMRIANGGNVGIGTTIPYSKLQIQNASNTRLLVQVVGTEVAGDNTGLYFKSAVNYSDAYIKGSLLFSNDGTGYGRGDLILANNNTGDGTNVSATDARITIKSNGNVGINTNSPGSYKLYVNGGQYGTMLRGGDLGTGSDVVRMIKSDNSVAMLVRGDGNIGIGTSTPGYKLDVNGDAKIGAYLYLGSEGSGSVLGDLSTGNYLRFLVSNIERMRITSAGNVGIGTTVPVGQLNIFGGTANNPAILTLQSQAGGSGLTGLYFRPYQNETFANSAEAQAAILAQDASYSAHLKFMTKVPGSGTNTLTERMRLTSTGNLGIGTTTPSTALDVNGTVNAAAYSVNGVAGYTGIVTIQQAPPMPNITIEIQNGIIVNVL